MLDDVREGFRDQEVGSELHGVGQTIPAEPSTVTGSGVRRASASTAVSSPSSRSKVG